MYKENIREVERLIANYFDGIFYGDVAKLKACFDSDVTIYGDIEGVNYLKTVAEYIEGVKNRQSPKDLEEPFQMRINGIDIIGKIAMVKLNVPMLGYNYFDYLSLVKGDAGWKIVNKIFTHLE